MALPSEPFHLKAVFITFDKEIRFFSAGALIMNKDVLLLKQMLESERFHNQLALNLGYQRIVNDKRINISIDDKRYVDDVMISISINGFSKPMCYRASEGLRQNDKDSLGENGYDEINAIVDAVHQAYYEAIKSF